MLKLIDNIFIHDDTIHNHALFVSVDFEFSRLDNSIGLVQFKFDQLGITEKLQEFNEQVQDHVVIIELRQVKKTSDISGITSMRKVRQLQERFLQTYLFTCRDNIFKISQGPFAGDVPSLVEKYGKNCDHDKNPVRFFVKNMLDVNTYYNVMQKINKVNVGGALYGFYQFAGIIDKEQMNEIITAGQRGMEERKIMGDISVTTHPDYKLYCYFDVRYLFECLLSQQNDQKLTGQEFMLLSSFITLQSLLRLFPIKTPSDWKESIVMQMKTPLKMTSDRYFRNPRGGAVKFAEEVEFINIPCKNCPQMSVSQMTTDAQNVQMKEGGKVGDILQKQKTQEGLTTMITKMLALSLKPKTELELDQILTKMNNNRIYHALASDAHHKKILLLFTLYWITRIDNRATNDIKNVIMDNMQKEMLNIQYHIWHYNIISMNYLRDLLVASL